MNIEILIATSGEEAVEQFKRHKNILLVLMDINMQGISGLEATE